MQSCFAVHLEEVRWHVKLNWLKYVMSLVEHRSGIAILTGLSLAGVWRWTVREVARQSVGQFVTFLGDSLVSEGIYRIPTDWWGPFYLLSFYLVIELRSELIALLKIFCHIITNLLYWFHWLCKPADSQALAPLEAPPVRADHRELTCLMAGPALEGFLLLERAGEWDEVWAACVVPNSSDLLVRTTSGDGTSWQWSVVRVNGGSMRAPVGAGVGRGPPAGINNAIVNWICQPTNLHQKWSPTADEADALKREGQMVGLQLSREGVPESKVTHPGTGMDLIALDLQPQAVAGGGGMAVARPAVAGGLGPSNGGSPGDAFNMQSLSDVVNKLKEMARKSGSKRDHSAKRRKKDKKRSSKKKKKKRSKDLDTSSSGSRSRSSRSSSASSSSRSSNAPIRWGHKAKSRSVDYNEVHALDMQRFKKKGELLAYATKHPGALSGHFLASVFARLSKGRVTKTSQLREASVVSWATQHAGLTEIRDIREVLTLAEAMDSINRREIARAMDILAQRILAVQQAKRKGGSWDKAEAIELIPSGNSLASSSMLALTN